MPLFITLEGSEGSGKTTQLLRLADYLQGIGHKVLTTREPGGCAISDSIRALLLDPASSNMAARAELLLYSAARAQHVEEVIRPALLRGEIVLCDRFSDAMTVYQGVGRGLASDELEAINSFATSGLTPDLTLLLDYPVEEGLRRAKARNRESQLEAEGRFELEALDFHRRIRAGYLDLAGKHDRIRVVDATGDLEDVFERVTAAIDYFLAGRRTA